MEAQNADFELQNISLKQKLKHKEKLIEELEDEKFHLIKQVKKITATDQTHLNITSSPNKSLGKDASLTRSYYPAQDNAQPDQL